MLLHTLKTLQSCAFIDSIVVCVSRSKMEETKRLIKKYKVKKILRVVAGGRKRFDSVKNGLKWTKDADFILIHDGARPLAERALIYKVFAAAKKFGGAICATPLKQTLKAADRKRFVKNTPDRALLWEAQTPQAFRKDLIVKAYRNAKERGATDDSVLAERLGHKIKIVRGSYRNIKITTPEDLALARVLMRHRI